MRVRPHTSPRTTIRFDMLPPSSARQRIARSLSGWIVARVEAALEEETDDPDEGWREHCRDTYVLCRDQKKPRWVGTCYECFRWCEGQRQWPFTMCWQKRR
jgi:hypothetical protein